MRSIAIRADEQLLKRLKLVLAYRGETLTGHVTKLIERDVEACENSPAPDRLESNITMKSIAVRVEDELFHRVKQVCVTRGETLVQHMTALIEDDVKARELEMMADSGFSHLEEANTNAGEVEDE